MQLVQKGFVKITEWQHSDLATRLATTREDGILSRSVISLRRATIDGAGPEQ